MSVSELAIGTYLFSLYLNIGTFFCEILQELVDDWMYVNFSLQLHVVTFFCEKFQELTGVWMNMKKHASRNQKGLLSFPLANTGPSCVELEPVARIVMILRLYSFVVSFNYRLVHQFLYWQQSINLLYHSRERTSVLTLSII